MSVIHRAGLTGLDECRQQLLAEELKQLIAAEDMSFEDVPPDACPRCGDAHVVRRGRDADGTQRWLCRGCRRTFTGKSRSLVASSRLDEATWDRFVDGMVEGLTLRELADRCGVCVKTSWYMRKRILSLQGLRSDAHLMRKVAGLALTDETES